MNLIARPPAAKPSPRATDGRGRRRFIRAGLAWTSVGLLVGCGLLPTPQTARAPRVGFLKQPPFDYVDLFLDEMRELGYVQGQNFVFEYRYAERQDQLPANAAELVRLGVDVIVAPNTAAVDAARQATTTIPIIMVHIPDPVAGGYVSSLSRPEGTITGTSHLATGLTGKRLQILKDTRPGVSRVGVLWVPNVPTSVGQWRETQQAAQDLGLELISLEVERPGDFEAAFDLATRERIDALFMPIAQQVMAQLSGIASFAVARRLPSMAFQREYADVGGLMSYGPNISTLYRRAAYYVDRVLKGAKVADLPVEQPTKFDFVINLKTAQAIGLAIPQSVLIQASEMIQ